MNKLLLALLATSLVFFSCKKWRPKEYPDPNDVLISAQWELEEHLNVPYDSTAPDCRLPKYLTFNEDKTGYYYYPNPCDSPGIDTLKFTWYYKPNDYRLYLQFQNLVAATGTAGLQFIICDYDMLRMINRTLYFVPHGSTKQLIDGNFRPVKKQ